MPMKYLLRTAVNAVTFLLFSQVIGLFHFHVVLVFSRKRNVIEDFQYFPVLAHTSDLVSGPLLESHVLSVVIILWMHELQNRNP